MDVDTKGLECFESTKIVTISLMHTYSDQMTYLCLGPLCLNQYVSRSLLSILTQFYQLDVLYSWL